MPYQFGNDDNGVIILSDSSEDEDDVVTPTNRRNLHTSQYESTATTADLSESEVSTDSDIDEVDYIEISKRSTRSRLQRGSTLKLKREIEDLKSTTEQSEPELDATGTDVVEAPQGNVRRREAFKKTLELMEDADDLELLYPKSLHPNHQYPEDISDEHDVLMELVTDEVATEVEEDMFEELELSDFSIYRGILHDKGCNGQFESPHVVSSERDALMFYLDGVIHHGSEQRRIIGAVIHDINIGGLADTTTHTTSDHIWVQTKQSRRRHDCWYRLSCPSAEYSSTWLDFVWLADFNKRVLDYLGDASVKAEKVYLRHFQAAFWEVLSRWHGEDIDFKNWSERCGSIVDFRMHLTIHAAFLRDQAWTVCSQDGFDSDILDHPVWTESGVGRFTEDQQSNSHHEKTVVTPNIGSAFTRSFPKWVLTPNVAIILEEAATANQTTKLNAPGLVGKVIIVRPSTTQNGSRARSYEDQFRFAYVHQVTKSGRAVRVIWLTQACGTICGSDHDRSFYPVAHELFFTDHCNCRPVALSRIVSVSDASVFPNALDTPGNIIVQLLYREDDAAFVNPETSELLCNCQHDRIDVLDPHPPTASSISNDEPPKIRNMSLFSGCGLLDSGLENFETVLVLDHVENAVCSYAANNTSKRCTHVVGSVNPHLRHFLTGESPMPVIDCITAGCPCKGFSLLNAHRSNKKSQRNCTLLASVLSWIDLFLPKLVLIENVPRMDFSPNDKDLANACAQAICCLVAMGYQVRKVLLTAYEYGSPTLRTRLFLIAAAPGVSLPERPEPTHGDEPDLEPIVTVKDVLEGSGTSIHNDSVVNIQDPAHIPIQRLKPVIGIGVSLRGVVKRIPKTPGSGLYQAHERGLLSKDQKRWFYSLSDEQKGPNSKTLRRIDQSNPFKTMVTIISPLDCRFGGEIVHPYEDRLLSLKEIRRAQGIPDSFLLVGSLKNQIELVGNGVAWQVAAALGRSFGQSWSKYCESIEGHDDGLDKSRLTQRILQLPQKMSAQFTEATRAPDAGAATRSSPALERYSNDGSHLQRRLREMSLEEDVAGVLPEGDTVEVKSQSSGSPSPKRETNPRIRARNSSMSPARKREVTVSMPITNSRTAPKIEDTQALAGRGIPRDRSTSEEVYEVSDHESLVITPNGTHNYRRSQRGKLIRRASSAKKPGRLVPMVIIPANKKRGPSPEPPPPTMTQPKISEPVARVESDSEV